MDSGVCYNHFYPRSPCGERLLGAVTSPAVIKFLSTLSLRRATACIGGIVDNVGFLSTLSLRRATARLRRSASIWLISIHALLAESDADIAAILTEINKFLSTLSLRRATCSFCPADSQGRHFYPRSPCGERLTMPDLCQRYVGISIHALLAESDNRSDPSAILGIPFLSTLSLRRATI